MTQTVVDTYHSCDKFSPTDNKLILSLLSKKEKKGAYRSVFFPLPRTDRFRREKDNCVHGSCSIVPYTPIIESVDLSPCPEGTI